MTKKVKTKKENKIRKCGRVCYKRHTASDKDMGIKVYTTPFSAILPFFSSFLF